MNRIASLSENKIMKKICAFLDGALFPVFLGGAVFLLYALNLPILGLAVCFLLASFIFLFSEDTRPAIAVAFLVILTGRYKDNLDAYLSKLAFAVYAVLGAIFVFAVVYRLVFRRVEWKKKSGLLGMAFFCAAILIGGAFSKYATLKNTGYVVAYSAVAFFVYAFFAFTLKKREDNLLYLARVCAVVIGVIALQVFELYLRLYVDGTELGIAWKNKIVLGWSISNMVAEMMVFLFPAVFYLISKEKYGYLYWALLFVSVLAIGLTLCRNAVLWGGLAIVAGVIANCFVGRHKLFHRCVAIAGITCFVGGLVLIFALGYGDKLFSLVERILSGSDHSRGFLLKKHWFFFLESPVNGVGFQAYSSLHYAMVTYAHNNLVQILASCGIVGMVLYLMHRIQTVCLVVKKPTAPRLFMGGCILVMLGISMLSPTFFLPYFMIYYSIILVSIEKE